MPKCRECGYDLSGLARERRPVVCPECGSAVPAADQTPRLPDVTWAELGRWRWVLRFAPGGTMFLTWTLATLNLPSGWGLSNYRFMLGPPTATWIACVLAASWAARTRRLSRIERTNFVAMAAAQSLVFALIAWMLALLLGGVLSLAS